MKINSRITAAFVVVIAVAVVVMAYTSRFYINNVFDRYAKGYRSVLMEHWENMFASYYRYNGNSWTGVEAMLTHRPRGRRMFMPHRQEGPGFLGIMPGERLLLADAEGRVVLDSLQEKNGQILAPRILEQGTPVMHGGEQVGTLFLQPQTAMTVLTLEEEFSRSALQAVFWGGLAALLAGVALSYLLAGQLARPLALLTASAQKFARGEFQHRVRLARKDEIGKLAEAYNFMAESIEKNEALRRNLLADVSHELRTPLTVLRGNLEALQAGKMEAGPELLSSLYDEVLRLTRLVSDLESINLAQAGKLPLHFSEADLALLLSRASAPFQHEANERGIKFAFELEEGLQCWCLDEDRVIQVLINLLANAFKFTPDGGKIKLDARAEKGSLLLAVYDSGPGIPEKELPFIFKRFYKTSPGRGGGSGLGLSIAKSLVEAHGGTIKAYNNPAGGSVFAVTLPFHALETDHHDT